MHPHLHTKDNIGCTEVMLALEECHAKGFIWKALGACNDAKDAVSACLRLERAKRQQENRTAGRGRMDKVREGWKDIDENS